MTATSTRSALVELRRYRLHPGRRDELIELFDREFVESQEAAGLQVLGQFRDADQPDHFVWLRGFATDDPGARADALSAFYGGPVWAEHRAAANATMIDSDDVLLLRPARADTGLPTIERSAAPAERGGDSGVVLATTCLLTTPAEATGALDATIDALRDAAAAEDRPLPAVLVSAAVPNRFPALPVREGEHALVWLELCTDLRAAEAALAARRARAGWLNGVPEPLAAALREPPLVSKLLPTARSLLPAAT